MRIWPLYGCWFILVNFFVQAGYQHGLLPKCKNSKENASIFLEAYEKIYDYLRHKSDKVIFLSGTHCVFEDDVDVPDDERNEEILERVNLVKTLAMKKI